MKDYLGVEAIKDLQESLQRELALKQQIKKLQEQLSVCYTKDSKKDAEILKLKSTVIKLTESAKEAKGLKKQVSELKEYFQ